MKQRLVLALLLWLLAAPMAFAGDCPLDLGHGTGLVIFSDRYMVAFRPDPPKVEAGEPFVLILNLCTRAGEPAELEAVESDLPDHPSVQVARPTIVPGGNGRFRVEGLLYRMAGNWQVTFVVRMGQETARISHEIAVR